MRVAIYTLGCKVNQFESWAISEMFEDLGCQIVDWKEDADIYVVNTCAVTSKAAYQSRQALNRIKRKRPHAKIIATGCHVQTDPGAILRSVGSGICLAGNEKKHLIAPMSLKHKGCTGVFVSDIMEEEEILPLTVKRPPKGRTRAFLKIQDGCNAFCSYCIVPYARGKSRSLSPHLIFEEVKALSEKGIKEVVLTGIHLGAYGKDLSEDIDLFALLKDLCKRFKNIYFRISSIEPTEISIEFVTDLSHFENFCPHFHIPLQSGSDNVLKAMNRKYSVKFFEGLIFHLKDILPHSSIGTDVLTGFPKETQEDFEKTVTLLERLPVSYLHAFPYSPRPGTLAYGMKRVCTQKEAKKRARSLITLGRKKRRDFMEKFLGEELNCLFERRDKKTGLFEGHSTNYIKVQVKFDKDISNRRGLIKVKEVREDFVIGQLLHLF